MPDKKILIVDPDTALCDHLSQVCRDFGFKVGALSEGNGLVSLLEDDLPDVLVLAVELPDKNGFVLCKDIRSHSKLKSLPLILVSKEPDPSVFEKHKKLKYRASAYLNKPFEALDMIDLIEDLIGLVPYKPPVNTTVELNQFVEANHKIDELQKTLHAKSEENSLLRESYENVKGKMERLQAEVQGYVDQYKRAEQQTLELQQDHQEEIQKYEEIQREQAQEFEQKLQEYLLKNEDLQTQLEQMVGQQKEFDASLKENQRRTELVEQENYKREKELKDRINELLTQVDEAHQKQNDIAGQLETAMKQAENEREDILHQLEEMESEKVKMEQRVVKAYKKIKLDQIRDEKIQKALNIALTLFQNPGAADSDESTSSESSEESESS